MEIRNSLFLEMKEVRYKKRTKTPPIYTIQNKYENNIFNKNLYKKNLTNKANNTRKTLNKKGL